MLSLKLSISIFNSTTSSSLESTNTMSHEVIVVILVRVPQSASKINLFRHYSSSGSAFYSYYTLPYIFQCLSLFITSIFYFSTVMYMCLYVCPT